MFALYFLIPHYMTGHLRPNFFSSTVGILFGQCCASQRSLGSGIFWDPSPISPSFFLVYWLWPTRPSFFSLCIFKVFSFHGSLDPNSLGISFILLFFLFLFFLHYRIAQCVIFLWALGCGQFWTSTFSPPSSWVACSPLVSSWVSIGSFCLNPSSNILTFALFFSLSFYMGYDSWVIG